MPSRPVTSLQTPGTPSEPGTFVALDTALEMIRSLAVCVPQLVARDPDLANQVRRAASSTALNLAEGRRRTGKDKAHFFRIASGSAGEVVAALQVAEAWGLLEATDVTEALAFGDRILAMCWKLTR